MKLSILRPYLLLSITVLVSACGESASESPTNAANSTATSTTGGVGNFCDATPLIQEACSGRICHGEVGKPAMYSTDFLNPPPGQTLGQVLMNKPANYELTANPPECPQATPELLINSAAPAESLMLKKVLGTQACGLKMPNVKDGDLTPDEVNCLTSWIQGAITAAGLTVTGGVTSSSAASTTGGGTTTGGTATGTSTTGDSGPLPPSPTFRTMRDVINFSSISCLGSDCHGGVEGRLNLRDDAMLYERLTTWTSELCGNKLVVNPSNPDQSAILDVLTTGCGNVSPNCLVGTECIPQMPMKCTPGFDCIGADYVDNLRQWIAAGAPPQ